MDGPARHRQLNRPARRRAITARLLAMTLALFASAAPALADWPPRPDDRGDATRDRSANASVDASSWAAYAPWLVAAGLAAMLVVGWRRRSTPADALPALHVVGRLALTAQHALTVVECDGRRWLLAIHKDGVQSLAEWTPKETSEGPPASAVDGEGSSDADASTVSTTPPTLADEPMQRAIERAVRATAVGAADADASREVEGDRERPSPTVRLTLRRPDGGGGR